ncbi:MAG: orotidine-5'-phosphate decarboxylase [Deltaproteobacteria bacterium]|nr:orotidine-5'-phosphate decarboxylase [Deltaproteobacteria bacterium]
MAARDRLAFALDAPDLARALPLLRRVAPEVGVVKVGLELFVRAGPDAIRAVREATDRAPRVFLDLKLHDIPRTVERAAANAAALGVELLTVHAAGGAAMLGAACSGAGDACRIVAVTALTSLGAPDLRALGVADEPAAWVDRLTDLAIGAGCAGIVCSPLEAAAVRARHRGALIVTPGVRPAGAPSGDQARTSTPEDAVRAGADLVVVGRPIHEATDPGEAARGIVRSIAAALGET